MIKEAYCSFEVSKMLKEKGFDEPCRAYWDDQPVLSSRTLFWTIESHKHYNREVSAPTHQMAMAWLREIHHIIFVFKPSYFSGDECTYWSYERWCGFGKGSAGRTEDVLRSGNSQSSSSIRSTGIRKRKRRMRLLMTHCWKN